MSDTTFLKQAVELAQQSKEPVGCGAILIDKAGNIVASACNSQRNDGLTASHAEMKAIAAANTRLGRKLTGLTAYGNCEPCTMCLTAFVFAGVERVVFANRLNDLVEPAQQIDIDCFEFVKNFPRYPVLEHIQV